MKLPRPGLVVGLVASATLLAACGSDDTGSTPAGGNSPSASGSASGAAVDCPDGDLNWDGSSAQKQAVNAWIQAFQNKCSSVSINYAGNGSGGGRTSFIQKQIPVAGSDSHLNDEQQPQADKRCAGGKAVNIPMVLTPVALIYNIKGVDKLTLTPVTIAKIFSGKITTWNDPAIKAANSGVNLPATTITSVHRASDSGTTDNFAKFLDAQDKADWTYGTGQAWKAPGGVGAKDSSALVQNVKGTDGAIGYVDGPDATKNGLTPAALDTGSGPVELNADSVGKAVQAAEVTVSGQDITVKINYGLKQAGAYPAVLATYEITCTAGLPADQAKFVKSFLTFTASAEGQALLAPLGHVALPADLLTKVQAAVAALPAG